MITEHSEDLTMETSFFHVEEVLPGTRAYELYLEFRYEVFCKELHRVVPESFPLSSLGRPMETDKYDQHSRHFMSFHKGNGIPAASVRVILPNPVGLNVASRYVIDFPLPYADALESNIGEISRMAISPMFRRRKEDRNKPFQGDPEWEMSQLPDNHRLHQPELVLGMYREIYLLCKQRSINYCMAAMEHRFSRLLRTLGFPWVSISAINHDVTPPRRVYLISADELERSLSQRETCILSFLQAQEANHQSAHQ